MYMLDTNTVIYFFKGMGEIGNNLFSKSPKEIYISSIVLYELEVGIAKSNNPKKRKEQLFKLIDSVNILEFGLKEAKQSTMIRANLESKGTPIGPIDTLIAGSAKANGFILITHNTKEFSRVESLDIEDWF